MEADGLLTRYHTLYICIQKIFRKGLSKGLDKGKMSITGSAEKSPTSHGISGIKHKVNMDDSKNVQSRYVQEYSYMILLEK